jgi:superfamily II DNA/RNA helicase
MRFADIGLSDELLRAVTDAGYEEATPIQEQAIPSVLMMRDIIGIAQTGTGKTASFVLPMIDILAQGRARARMPRSLILEPTRELAAQVAENFVKYGKYHKLSMALLIGGVSMGDQVKALEKGVDVLIATPGRLMDLFGRGNILLNGCDLLVIDEADRMLDMGFIPDIEEICTKLPAQRQTLLFSATMPPPIKKLSDKFLTNPKYIEVARPATANVNIEQKLVDVAPAKKRDVLNALLRAEKVETGIIFCNRKTTVRELNKSLSRDGFRSGEIHGDIDQGTRQRQLEAFKSGEINLLVASDVAARGLDIKGVSHVFNYDAPWHPDDYVHRIGRTGRAGAKGKAFTFVTKADAEAIDNIEKLIGYKIERTGEVKSAPAEKKIAADKPAARKESKPAARADSAQEARKDSAPSETDAPKIRRRGAKRSVSNDAPKNDAAEASPILAPKPAAKAKPAKPSAAVSEDSGNDDGWNGPLPGFLSVGFGG